MPTIDLDNYSDYIESDPPPIRNFLSYKATIPAPVLLLGSVVGLLALFSQSVPVVTELPPASIVVSCRPPAEPRMMSGHRIE